MAQDPETQLDGALLVRVYTEVQNSNTVFREDDLFIMQLFQYCVFPFDEKLTKAKKACLGSSGSYNSVLPCSGSTHICIGVCDCVRPKKDLS